MPSSARSGALLLMGSQAAFVATTYLIHLYLAYRLDVPAYGDYALALSILQSLQIAIQNGVPEILSRETASKGYDPNSRAEAVKAQLIYSAVVMLALALAGPFMAKLFGDPSWILYMWLGALLVPARALFLVLKSAWNGARRFGHDSGLVLLYSVIRIIPVVILVELGLGVSGVVMGFVVGAVFAAAGAYLIGKPGGEATGSPMRWKEFFMASLPVAAFGILYNALSNADLVLLRLLSDDGYESGMYAAVWTVSRAGFVILLALPAVALPSISAELGAPRAGGHSANHRPVIEKARRSAGLALLLSLACLTVAIVDGSGIIRLLYPDEYAKGGGVLALSFAGAILISFAVLQGNILIATGRQKGIYLPFLLAMAVTVVVAVATVPAWGMYGAAASICAGGLVAMATITIMAKKRSALPAPGFLAGSAFSVLIACMIGLALIQFMPSVAVWVVTLVAFAFFAFAFGLVRLEDVPFMGFERAVVVDKAEMESLASSTAEVSEHDRDEMAIPSYTHANPALRWLVWRRVGKAVSLAELDKSKTVLDFGCGTGVMLPTLSKDSGKVVALDLFPQFAKEMARRRKLGNVSFVKDLHEIPNASIDTVFAIEVMEHLDDPAGCAREFKRVLRPGGTAVISGPTEDSFYKLARRVAGFHKKGEYHHRNIDDIVRAVKEAGFKEEERVNLPLPIPPNLFKIIRFKAA